MLAGRSAGCRRDALPRAVGDEHSNAAHDPHAQAHLGAVDAALAAADAVLIAAACPGRRSPEPPLCQSGINRTARTRRSRNHGGRNDRQNRTGIGPCAPGTRRRTRSPGRRFDHLRTAEPRRTRPRGARAIGRAFYEWRVATPRGWPRGPRAGRGHPGRHWTAWDCVFPELEPARLPGVNPCWSPRIPTTRRSVWVRPRRSCGAPASTSEWCRSATAAAPIPDFSAVEAHAARAHPAHRITPGRQRCLGCSAPIGLGLPDGQLADHEIDLADLLDRTPVEPVPRERGAPDLARRRPSRP